MIVSIMVSMEYGSLGNVDPSRIAAGVVTGIGFLGAGAILRNESNIVGLTTAASVWSVSAVGLAVGAGLYVPGFIAAMVMLVVLILSRFEEKLDLKKCDKIDKVKE